MESTKPTQASTEVSRDAVGASAFWGSRAQWRRICKGAAMCVGSRLGVEFIICFMAVLPLAIDDLSADAMMTELSHSLELQLFLIAAGVWSCVIGGYAVARRIRNRPFACAALAGCLASWFWFGVAIAFPGGQSLSQIAGIVAPVPAAWLGAYCAAPRTA